MGRWLRVLLGPLPATVLLLPLLFAGGLGAALALVAGLIEPGRSAAERWASVSAPSVTLAWVAAAGIGTLALWIAVLAEAPTTLRQTRLRWWLIAGLALGLLAAARWLRAMGASGRSYGPLTWVVWLALLAGPLVLGSYYFVHLVRGGGQRHARPR
jgi:hypothetical protein